MSIFPSIDKQLDHINKRLSRIMATLDDIQAKVSALMDKMTAQRTVTDSIVTLINGLKQQIADLRAALEAAGGNQAKIDAVVAGLQTLEESIDADTAAEAAIANTPTE